MLATIIATKSLQRHFSKITDLSFLHNACWVWRTPDKRSETIPLYRIFPDPSDSQLHVSTSLQFTSLIVYRVQVRVGRPWQKLHFVLSDTFLGWFWWLVWIIVLMDFFFFFFFYQLAFIILWNRKSWLDNVNKLWTTCIGKKTILVFLYEIFSPLSIVLLQFVLNERLKA